MADNPQGAKAVPIARNPLATARQLWALNRAGKLAYRPSDTEVVLGPLSAQHADAAIKALNSELSPE